MHVAKRPCYLHTEPPVPPPNPQPEGEPVRPLPLPPDSPYPGKPQDDPPQGPPDQPLEPPPPIVAAKPGLARPLAGTRQGAHMILALAMLLASATVVWAAEPLDPQDRPAAFRQLDADGDGWISVEEAAAQPEVAENFQKADRDRDGRLSFDEFEGVALNRSDQPGKFRNPDRG